MSIDPRFDRVPTCTSCHKKPASEHSAEDLCPMCWMQWRIDQDDVSDAYTVADVCGFPHSTVRRLIRDTNEQRMAAEVARAIAAGCASATSPLVRAQTRAVNRSVRSMLEAVALLDAPSNDNSSPRVA